MTCPTGKREMTQKEAIAVAYRRKLRRGWQSGSHYLCDRCGHWHTSRKPRDKNGDKARRR